MREGFLKWTVYLLALFLFGPLAGSLTGALRAVDGGPGATPLVSAHPMAGLLAALAAIAIALVTGLLGARLLGAGPGMIAAGLVLAWATWNTGTVDELLRTAHSGAPFLRLALEGVIFGILGVLLATAVALVGRAHKSEAPKRSASDPNLSPRRLVASNVEPALTAGRAATNAAGRTFFQIFQGKGGSIAFAVAIIAGGVAAWFVGVSPLKGQALGAAIASAVLAAAAGRLVEISAPMPSLFVAIAALAVLGPLSGVATAGTGLHAVELSYKGALFPLANICPLDWIAGGLIGIPLGVAWAGSMIERHHE